MGHPTIAEEEAAAQLAQLSLSMEQWQGLCPHEGLDLQGDYIYPIQTWLHYPWHHYGPVELTLLTMAHNPAAPLWSIDLPVSIADKSSCL